MAKQIETQFSNRGGPFGEFSGDVGPRGGAHVEVTRDEGQARDPFDAHTAFTVTLEDGTTISGDAHSVVVAGTGEGEFVIEGENGSVSGDGSFSVAEGEAEGEVVFTNGQGDSWTITGEVNMTADQELIVHLDVNGDAEGGDLCFVFDTIDHTLEMNGPMGRGVTIDVDDMLTTLQELASTVGEWLPDDVADAA